MTTPLLKLPEIAESVSNQTTLHNQALRLFEALAVRVLSKDVAAPPAAVDGDSYIIPAGATGAWAGKGGQVAAFVGGGWSYVAPFEGWSLRINDIDADYVYKAGAWTAAGGGAAAVAAHEAAADPHPQYALESTIGQANGIAGLGADGKLPAAQLPNLAIIDFLGTVANQAAMLALSGQKGDWCARSDTSTVYVITGADPTQASSWTALSYPTGTGGTVTSVALTTPGVLFDVVGSPVTSAGALAMSLKTQVKNTFLAGPASGADATPTMRALTQADLPAQPFDLTAFYPGVPSASAIVTRVPVARAVSFPAGLAGSIGRARVAATGSTVFSVQKNGASVGSLTFAASATSATFTAGSAITLAAGDILSIHAPATADATLADVGIVLAGTR